MNFYDELKILVKKINFSNFNFNIINNNINKLSNIYKDIKIIWDSIHINNKDIKLINDLEEYNIVNDLIFKTFLINNIKIKNFIKSNKNIFKISYLNINLYFVYQDLIIKEVDQDLVLFMFKISVCLYLYKYPNKNDNIIRNIIWIPINSERNFLFDKINNYNLSKSYNHFEAFVASGVTWGDNPKNTIITRYEEVIKLLCHELIHNYNYDGSLFHNNFEEIISEYKNIKNNINTKIKNYDYEYSIYESYTELLSTYFYLIFENLKNNCDYKLIKENFKKQILLEIIYSYNIIANLARLNNYYDWNQFNNKQIFKGDICFYEYYYIKGLMYNNFNFTLGLNEDEFKIIYLEIINMIKKINNKKDELLKEIFNNYIKQKNFKYIIH